MESKHADEKYTPAHECTGSAGELGGIEKQSDENGAEDLTVSADMRAANIINHNWSHLNQYTKLLTALPRTMRWSIEEI